MVATLLQGAGIAAFALGLLLLGIGIGRDGAGTDCSALGAFRSGDQVYICHPKEPSNG